MRKQSDATKLRRAKAELSDLRNRLAVWTHELKTLRLAGSLCANACYNLSHRTSPLEPHDRECLETCYREWDSVIAALPAPVRTPESKRTA